MIDDTLRSDYSAAGTAAYGLSAHEPTLTNPKSSAYEPILSSPKSPNIANNDPNYPNNPPTLITSITTLIIPIGRINP